MNNISKVALGIFLTATVLGLVYVQIEIQNLKSSQGSGSSQPQASTTLSPTIQPTVSSTGTPITTPASSTTPLTQGAKLNVTAIPSYELPNYAPNSGEYLWLNGTVTNNSPNDYISPALRVTAKEEGVNGYAINMLLSLPEANAPGVYQQYSQKEQIIQGESPPGEGATTFRSGQSYSVDIKILTLAPTDRNNYTIYDVNISLG